MSLILIALVLMFGFSLSEPQIVETARVCTQNLDSECVIRPAEGWVPVSFDGFEGVIVPADDASADGWLISEGAWTPSEAEVMAAEDAIEEAQGPLDHMRQYVGITQDGERKIHVSGFCDAAGLNWQGELVFVMDGGDCYFSATYNVETGELESFIFNGDA